MYSKHTQNTGNKKTNSNLDLENRIADKKVKPKYKDK
jgi:hypothetical protein